VIVTGGRSYRHRDRVFSVLDDLRVQYGDLVIVHGGCRGADYLAGLWAESRGQKVLVYPADWDRYGLSAGPRRNSKMIEENVDAALLVAFPGGSGTADCTKKAEKAGIRILLVT
jgi:hypothetical protein